MIKFAKKSEKEKVKEQFKEFERILKTELSEENIETTVIGFNTSRYILMNLDSEKTNFDEFRCPKCKTYLVDCLYSYGICPSCGILGLNNLIDMEVFESDFYE
jgi:hypothetical protein